MDIADYLRFVMALGFVIAMILLLAYLARRYGLGYRNIPKSMTRRLSISEIMPLDAKRRLVLIKRDDKEHLLVIGGENDLVVERNIADSDLTFDAVLAEQDSADTPEVEEKSS